MVRAAETGLDTLRSRRGRPKGALRIAAPGAIFETPRHFQHLADFRADFPEVQLSVSFSDVPIQMLGSAYDLALRVGWLKDSAYKARKLTELSRVIVASAEYVVARPFAADLSDIEGWDWIKLTQLSFARQLTNDQGDPGPIAPERIALEVDSVSAACTAARLGMGLVAVPRVLVADDLRAGRLVALAPNWRLAPVGLHAVWPDNVPDDGLPVIFARFLAARMAPV